MNRSPPPYTQPSNLPRRQETRRGRVLDHASFIFPKAVGRRGTLDSGRELGCYTGTVPFVAGYLHPRRSTSGEYPVGAGNWIAVDFDRCIVVHGRTPQPLILLRHDGRHSPSADGVDTRHQVILPPGQNLVGRLVYPSIDQVAEVTWILSTDVNGTMGRRISSASSSPRRRSRALAGRKICLRRPPAGA